MLSLRPIDHRSGGNNSSDTSSSSNQFRGYSQYPGLYASPYHSSFSSAVYPTSTPIHNFSDLSEIRDLRMPSTSGASSALSMAHDSEASTMHDAYRNHLQGHYNMNMAAHTNGGAAPAGGNNANDASHTNSASQGAINTQFPMAMPRPMGMYATENFSRASLPSPAIPASSTTNEAEDIKPSDLNNTTSPNGAPSPSGTDSTSPEASTPLSHHRSRSGPMRSRVVSRVPEEKKDATYWDKRKKNNESAKRSREQRKKKEETKEMQLAEYRRKEMAWSMERTLLVADNNRLRAVLHQNNIPAPPSMMNPGEMQVDQLYSPATNPALYQQLMQQQQQQQQQQALQLNTNT